MNCPHCFTKLQPGIIRISSGGVRCLHCMKFVPIVEGSPEETEIRFLIDDRQGTLKKRLALEQKRKKGKI
jgi:hypothetical protein